MKKQDNDGMLEALRDDLRSIRREMRLLRQKAMKEAKGVADDAGPRATVGLVIGGLVGLLAVVGLVAWMMGVLP